MALIKCAECGKEISNKATTCPNCGCPIELESNNNNDKKNNSEKVNNKFLIKSIRDKSLNTFKKVYNTIITFGIIGIILFILIASSSNGFYTEILIAAIVFGGIPIGIIYFICSTIYKNAIKTFIQLNEKELYGEIYHLFRFENISFPIDKISSINSIKEFGCINGIIIVSTNGKPQKILFVDNCEEFRQAIVNQSINI